MVVSREKGVLPFSIASRIFFSVGSSVLLSLSSSDTSRSWAVDTAKNKRPESPFLEIRAADTLRLWRYRVKEDQAA